VTSIGEELEMDRRHRKNRPKKKEIPQERWDETIKSLQNQFGYSGHHEKDKNPKKE
jgi:hypothetical protein